MTAPGAMAAAVLCCWFSRMCFIRGFDVRSVGFRKLNLTYGPKSILDQYQTFEQV
jgi:hypothetical protein